MEWLIILSRALIDEAIAKLEEMRVRWSQSSGAPQEKDANGTYNHSLRDRDIDSLREIIATISPQLDPATRGKLNGYSKAIVEAVDAADRATDNHKETIRSAIEKSKGLFGHYPYDVVDASYEIWKDYQHEVTKVALASIDLCLKGIREIEQLSADGRKRVPIDNEDMPYDVVVSFAGEDRGYAEQLSKCLTAHGVRVFYDRYEAATLWGKNLYDHLSWVYRDAGRYCVIFVSESYAKKLWTNHERKAAQARAFKEKREYILPVRLDGTEIPGLLETVAYVDIRESPIEDVCNLVLRKLGS